MKSITGVPFGYFSTSGDVAEGYGVHIAYHVPARLMSLFWENAQEQQEEEMHRTGKLSDADYETVKRLNRGGRLWREMFMQWASENAIIDDEGK